MNHTTDITFDAATCLRWDRGDHEMCALARCSADIAWGALKAGWDTYDLGRGRQTSDSAASVLDAVIDVITRTAPPAGDVDAVDDVAAQALTRLGYQADFDRAEPIVTGRL